VKAPPGVNLTKGNLHKHNQAIMGYIHGDDTRKTILAADGVFCGGRLWLLVMCVNCGMGQKDFGQQNSE